MPSGADRCLATEPSRSTTPWCGTLNREHELQRRPITLTARVHNALDKPRSFTDAAQACAGSGHYVRAENARCSEERHWAKLRHGSRRVVSEVVVREGRRPQLGHHELSHRN